MFGKVKQFLKKIRIFKRLRAYKLEIGNLIRRIYDLDMELAKKERQFQSIIAKNNTFMFKLEDEKATLKKELGISKEKHDKASKHYGELVKRRDEVIHRLQSITPDSIISGRFADYKLWIAEPFVKEGYKHYVMKEPLGNVFIDGDSAIRGLSNVFNVIDDENVKEEEKE